jgi:hypothetical protein
MPRSMLWLILPICMVAGTLPAQTNCNLGAKPLRDVQPEGISTDQIMPQVAAHEAELKAARSQYAYTQEIKVQTLRQGVMPGDFLPDGEFRQIAEVSYAPNGHRIENVTFAPQSTLRRVTMTQEDFDDILERTSFVLLPETLPHYTVHYAGQQRIDELETYVFDVAPATVHKDRRYFQGRVWIEMRDLAIVKSCGKTVPDVVLPPKKKKGTENIHPTFVTYRDHIDGKYWLPVYSRSDDYLHFRTGDVRLREIVKFSNHRKAEPKSRQKNAASALEKAAH